MITASTLAWGVIAVLAFQAPVQNDQREQRRLFDTAFETAMAIEAPGWSRSSLPPVSGPQTRPNFYERWSHDGNFIKVRYTLCGSLQEAAEEHQGRKSVLPVGTREIPGYGNASYITGPAADGSMMIHFYRGDGVFDVSAPTEEFARRLTRSFVAAIDQTLTGRGVPK